MIFLFFTKEDEKTPIGKSARKTAILSKKDQSLMAKSRKLREEEALKNRRRFDQMLRAGLDRKKFPVKGDHVFVNVAFRPKGVCHMGDYNFITHDLKTNQLNRVLVSLEPLDPESSLKPLSFLVTQARLKKGFSRQFRLPRDLDREMVGIFLCSDRSGTDRCIGKKPVDLNDLLDDRFQKAMKRQDRVYLFSFLIVNGSQVEFSLKPFTSPSDQASLRTYLASEYQSSRLNRIFKGINAFTQKLQSYPLHTSRRFVEIRLPYHRQKACY